MVPTLYEFLFLWNIKPDVKHNDNLIFMASFSHNISVLTVHGAEPKMGQIDSC